MGADPETLAFYDREAVAYAGYSEDFTGNGWLPRFAAALAPGAAVLDFGCGSAWAAHWLEGQGFAVEAFDGSAGLACQASERYGIAVDVGRFESFDRPGRYDGIWASFCLLHDSREAMPGHLSRLCAALRPGGRFYLGLKAGSGSRRDRLGRLYTYYAEPEIEGLLAGAGFVSIDITAEAATSYDGGADTVLHILADAPVRSA